VDVRDPVRNPIPDAPLGLSSIVRVDKPTPVPTLSPTPTPTSHALDSPTGDTSAVLSLICSYDWDCATAERVFKAENGYYNYGYWRPEAVSATGDYGITQINRSTWWQWLNMRGFDWDSEWMLVEENIAMAYEIWLDGGSVLKRSWHHWNAY
jgi:hypothetical protein